MTTKKELNKLQKEFISAYLNYTSAEELGKNIKPAHLSKLTDRASIDIYMSKNFDVHFTVFLSDTFEDHPEYFEKI